MRKLRLWSLVCGLLAVLLVSACTATTTTEASGSGHSAGSPPPAVSFEPEQGTKKVSPGGSIAVSVTNGKLRDVTLTSKDGKKVGGKLVNGDTKWVPTDKIEFGTTYKWSGHAVGDDGKTVPVRGKFATVEPKQLVHATISPKPGQTVGVAMPIRIWFDQPVRNKAAVQRALKVKTSKPVKGSWAWKSDDRLHWRPKEYWPEFTTVSVHGDLYGVAYGDGKYGKADLNVEFKIGRKQVTKGNVDSHRLRVYRNGKKIADYPASYGRPSNPDLHTHNGTYIVMARKEVQLMTNREYGYVNVPVKWAVRFSNHGEFIHAYDVNAANIGERNTSHGCVNLLSEDAKEYFDMTLLGDPVVITGSSTDMPKGYAVDDWLYSWQEWKSLSAI